MPSLSNVYRLTPGKSLPLAEDIIKKANLQILVNGFDTVYTSWGDNLNSYALANLVRDGVRQEAGPGATTVKMSYNPTTFKVVIPPQDITVDGLVIPFSGPAGYTAPYEFDFSNVARSDGNYAIIIEWWQSLVGNSTTTAVVPAGVLGVTDGANKPNVPPLQKFLYPNGHIERTDAATALDETELVDSLLQERKYLQLQWRVRVITDKDLTTELVMGTGVITYTAYPQMNGLGVFAEGLPTTQAYDGRYYAAKLAVVKKAGAAVTIFTNDILPDAGYILVGQNPLPYAPNRGQLISEYKAVDYVLQAEITANLDYLNSVAGQFYRFTSAAITNYILLGSMTDAELLSTPRNSMIFRVSGGRENETAYDDMFIVELKPNPQQATIRQYKFGGSTTSRGKTTVKVYRNTTTNLVEVWLVQDFDPSPHSYNIRGFWAGGIRSTYLQTTTTATAPFAGKTKLADSETLSELNYTPLDLDSLASLPAAIAALQASVASVITQIAGVSSALTAHITQVIDAHDASAISLNGTGPVSGNINVAASVQEAVNNIVFQLNALNNKTVEVLYIAVSDNPADVAGDPYGVGAVSYKVLGTFGIPSTLQGKRCLVSISAINSASNFDGTYSAYVRFSATPGASGFMYTKQTVPAAGGGAARNTTYAGSQICIIPISATQVYLDIVQTTANGNDFDPAVITLTFVEV